MCMVRTARMSMVYMYVYGMAATRVPTHHIGSGLAPHKNTRL